MSDEQNCNCGNDCGNDHCDHDHDMHKVVIETEDGETIDCNILGVFDVDEYNYIALLPINADEGVFVYRLGKDDEEPEIQEIESEEEYERVAIAFEEMFNCE